MKKTNFLLFAELFSIIIDTKNYHKRDEDNLSTCWELAGNDLSTCREWVGKECPNFLSDGNGKNLSTCWELVGNDMSTCWEWAGNIFLNVDDMSTCRELIGKECQNFLSGGNGKKPFDVLGTCGEWLVDVLGMSMECLSRSRWFVDV